MKSLLFRLIGIAVFLYLLFAVVGIRELWSTLQGMQVMALLAVIPFHFGQWLLRALRWQILLKNEKIDISLTENFTLAVAGFFLGCLTPGRLGEFAKVKFLMNAGFPFRGSFMSSLIERLLDLATLLMYVLFGLFISYSILAHQLASYLLPILAIILAVIAAWLLRSKIKLAVMRLIPESIAGSLEQKLDIFTNSFRKITTKQWIEIAICSLAIWGLNYWMIYLLFSAAGFTIALPYAFAFAAFGSLAGLLPISIYGMGIREAILIALFQFAGYAQDEAKTAGMIFGLMFMVLLVYHILLGFIGWMSPWMRRFEVKG